MGDSIADILSNRNLAEPPEIEVIKNFVKDVIDQTPQVSINKQAFVVYVRGASAANALRFRVYQLERSLGGQRKIILKIV